MPSWTRSHLLLKHTSGSVYLAFEVLVQDYDGDAEQFFRDFSRSKAGSLLVVMGTNKRKFYGLVILDSNATGSVTYDSQAYNHGTPANLLTCYSKTDLQAKTPEDSAFWNAMVTSVYSPKVVYEPTGDTRVTAFSMEEK